MSRRNGTTLRWIVAGALCAAAAQAQAQDASAEGPGADEYAPPSVSFTGLTGLMTVPTAETLPQGKFAFGAYYDWEIETDSRRQGMDTDIHQLALVGAVGLHDRLELGAQVPIVWFERDVFGSSSDNSINHVGDVTLQGAFSIVRRGVFLGQDSGGESKFRVSKTPRSWSPTSVLLI